MIARGHSGKRAVVRADRSARGRPGASPHWSFSRPHPTAGDRRTGVVDDDAAG